MQFPFSVRVHRLQLPAENAIIRAEQIVNKDFMLNGLEYGRTLPIAHCYIGSTPTKEMKKNFSANLLFLLVLNLLIKPVYVFGIEVGIQNEVGPSEYGLYYAMFNFTFLFNVLLDMGINNFQKIKVAEDSDAGMKNMATLLPLKLGLAVLYMGVTVTVAFLFGFEERYWYFIGWLMVF